MSSWKCTCGNVCGCDPCCGCGKKKALVMLEQSGVSPSACKFIHDGPPITQKAKGIATLKEFSSSGVNNLLPASYFALIKVSDPCPPPEWWSTLVATYGNYNTKIFARPCPPSPEHGFVESRVIKTYEELQKIYEETKAANEGSEIIFMTEITASHNFVWTPTLVTAGRGHDGATSGKDTISIPLVGAIPIGQDVLKAALITDDSKAPYVEAVTAANGSSWPQIFSTQLRSGPPLGNAVNPDFVPFTVTVAEVIKTNGEDLLEWAKVVRALKGRKDVVVWHPGGSLTDHYSVHCRENGVPILTTYEPVVGLVIDRIGDDIPPLDPNAIIQGLADSSALSLAPTQASSHNAIALALVALHNSAAMRGPHSYWIGFGVGAVLKLGAAALEAEARHAHSCFKGMTGKPDIYKFYGAKSLSFLRARVSRVSQLLHYGFGDPKASHSFGGPKWALCGAALCPLFDAVKEIVDKPSEENASKILLALNVAVNQAHNGGWWLNKFINVTAYDFVPKGSIGFACAAAQGALEFRQDLKSLGDANTRVERLKRQVAAWPATTTVSPLRWRKAAVQLVPNAISLTMKASTLPTPTQLTIPMSLATQKRFLNKVGKIIITPGRVAIDLEDGEAPIEVWNEEPLVATSRDVKGH